MFTIPGNFCTVHGYHWPKPQRTVGHHIHPLGYGGPDTAANVVKICDTGHYNVHTYLDARIARKPLPRVHRKERALAEAGYAAIVKAFGW